MHIKSSIGLKKLATQLEPQTFGKREPAFQDRIETVEKATSQTLTPQGLDELHNTDSIYWFIDMRIDVHAQTPTYLLYIHRVRERERERERASERERERDMYMSARQPRFNSFGSSPEALPTRYPGLVQVANFRSAEGNMERSAKRSSLCSSRRKRSP